jgi:hypothetical protein
MTICSFLEDQGLSFLDFKCLRNGVSVSVSRCLSKSQRNITRYCVYEYFHVLDGYEFLPFKHFQIYVLDTISPENDSRIWMCRYCNFWCEMFDPLIMEQHLCIVCAWTVLPSHQK